MRADLNPVEISQLLDANPHEAHQKGAPRTGNSGRVYSPYRKGLWQIRTNVEDRSSLCEHISWLSEWLICRKAAIRALNEQGYEIDIFVGAFSSDANILFSIEPNFLELIAELRLEIIFDVYMTTEWQTGK